MPVSISRFGSAGGGLALMYSQSEGGQEGEGYTDEEEQESGGGQDRQIAHFGSGRSHRSHPSRSHLRLALD